MVVKRSLQQRARQMFIYLRCRHPIALRHAVLYAPTPLEAYSVKTLLLGFNTSRLSREPRASRTTHPLAFFVYARLAEDVALPSAACLLDPRACSNPPLVQVDGYTQNYWGQGRAARDAVSPQDQLIEVDFRQGARSVFDDPRYVGQEGPTGGDAAGGSSA